MEDHVPEEKNFNNRAQAWHEFSAPITEEDAKAAHKAFLDEVVILRAKYRIPNLAVFLSNVVTDGDSWGNAVAGFVLGEHSMLRDKADMTFNPRKSPMAGLLSMIG